MKRFVFAALCLVVLSGCVHSDIPKNLMTCPDEPKPPQVTADTLDSDIIELWVEGVRSAGDHCRRNIRAIARISGK